MSSSMQGDHRSDDDHSQNKQLVGWQWQHFAIVIYLSAIIISMVVFSVTSLLIFAFIVIISIGVTEGSIFKKPDSPYVSLQDTYKWDKRGDTHFAS